MPEPQLACLVVAGVLRLGDRVLLVKQQGPQDAGPTWALPGGVVEAGELLVDALQRELREETGLEITKTVRLLYIVQVDDPARGSQSLAFVLQVQDWSGELRSSDPNGLILEVDFLPLPKALDNQRGLPWRNMREPAIANLEGRAEAGALWLYRRQHNGAEQLRACLNPGHLSI